METNSRKNFELGLDNIVNPIQRVDISTLTPGTFFEQFQKIGTPVIITGLLKQLDWNLDYLSEKLGNQKFLLNFYGQERYKQDKRQWTNIGSGVETQSMLFTEYADMLRNHQAHEKDVYLARCSLQNTTLANTDCLTNIGEQLGLNKPVSDLNIWVGPGGHVECLHYDTNDGTLMQLHGSKKVVLFPPSQTNNLYPFPFYIHLRSGMKLRSWFSQVYPERPDFKAFPKLNQALQHKCELILNPGEILYIPAGWWHEVTALGDEMVCSVNRFWSISPISRILFSWSIWRVNLGLLCALPHTLLSLVSALFSRERKQKIAKILKMF
ncbi:cupin-like domain-containing protein [Microcoleus sp. BROC3]|uniref:cupin-like domain-containing protein n=1 Tax=Microcoleus sp. BROC3 TaxID=3055323 RepID=UPI002FD3BE13